jgi:hypothetical protein
MQPTLPTLRLERPMLSREDRIALYLREDAELKSQIEKLSAKRADLKALLQEIGEDAFELWYLQEHGDIMNGYRKKELKRLARREAMEERERVVEEHRARISPEAQARLRASIEQIKARLSSTVFLPASLNVPTSPAELSVSKSRQSPNA